uniref:SHSP domain-containing protein n=1 Tax=Electrophorus electricus TaxID=8005 RepID=A0A4W4FG72_ELEEL
TDLALLHGPFLRPGYGWRPSLLYSQHFGLPPVLDSRDLLWLESVVRKLGDSSWPGLSEVYDQHGKWKVSLDVNHFAPSEIAVKMEGGFLEITGKHDERQDAHGYISRCFIRKYKLPVGVDAETIQSFLSGDGILSVEASFPDIPKPADVVIPVQVHYFNKFHFDVS